MATDLLIGGGMLLVAALASHVRGPRLEGAAEIVGTWRTVNESPDRRMVVLPEHRVHLDAADGQWDEVDGGHGRVQGGQRYRIIMEAGTVWTASVRGGQLVTRSPQREHLWVRVPR